MSIRQRIADWCHERRIRRLGRELGRSYAFQHGDRVELWLRYAEAIKARSPEQVARMEKARGLR